MADAFGTVGLDDGILLDKLSRGEWSGWTWTLADVARGKGGGEKTVGMHGEEFAGNERAHRETDNVDFVEMKRVHEGDDIVGVGEVEVFGLLG